jgi:copper chaperone NosL
MYKLIKGTRIALYLLILFSITSLTLAGTALAEGASCKYCGMMKAKFGHSWMVIDYDDGSKTEACSVHCAAMDLALNIDKTPKAIMVGDCNSKKLIDAEKAYWVIGGDKMGVMTMRPKWAFETKEAADKFISENGGKPATFDDAVKAAFEDMYDDTKMIRKKRKMMKMKNM